MVPVAVVRCPDYDPLHVEASVGRALNLLGGLSALIPRRTRVFVKINHLSPPSPPESGIVTHPAVTEAVLKQLKDLDAEITVGDDIQAGGGDGFRVSGYRELCRRLGVRLVNLKEDGFREVAVRGKRLSSAYFSPWALEAEAIINVPKLKTHSFMAFTGAVKNVFGCIPHGRRLEYHRRFSRQDDFAEMLVDLYSRCPPVLTVMDAVVAMEGEGPAGGSLRSLGLILASPDGVAVDAVAARLVGFDPLAVLTTRFAHRRGLGVGAVDRIAVVGERPEEVALDDFKASALASGLMRRSLPASLYSFFSGQLVLIPTIDAVRCTGCQECVRTCPTGAARPEGGAARIERSDCIHCLCCHEVCRSQAVRLKRRPLGRLIHAGGRMIRFLGYRI
jgi:uncharacterized protein (DUF362 family)/Pyruvate/2-oxoacid:ferredoxin oxidoreductase delta subunit